MLGAGNQVSVAALDILHKLVVDCAVVVCKMNPVNAWVGPFIRCGPSAYFSHSSTGKRLAATLVRLMVLGYISMHNMAAKVSARRHHPTAKGLLCVVVDPCVLVV